MRRETRARGLAIATGVAVVLLVLLFAWVRNAAAAWPAAALAADAHAAAPDRPGATAARAGPHPGAQRPAGRPPGGGG